MAEKNHDKVYATLVRGRVYHLKEQRFERNVPQEVTPEVKEHLEEHAYDLVTVEGRSEERQKFVFSNTPEPPRAPRRRQR